MNPERGECPAAGRLAQQVIKLTRDLGLFVGRHDPELNGRSIGADSLGGITCRSAISFKIDANPKELQSPANPQARLRRVFPDSAGKADRIHASQASRVCPEIFTSAI